MQLSIELMVVDIIRLGTQSIKSCNHLHVGVHLFRYSSSSCSLRFTDVLLTEQELSTQVRILDHIRVRHVDATPP